MGFNKIKRIKKWKLEQRRLIEGRYDIDDIEPSFSINGEDIDLYKLDDRTVSVDIFNSRGNSAGQNVMIRKMDNRSLMDFIYNALENVGIKSNSDITYDECVMNILLPELLDRFEDMDRKQNPSKYVDNPKVLLNVIKDRFILHDTPGKNEEVDIGVICYSGQGRKSILNEVINTTLNEDICLNIEDPLG